MRRSDNRAFVNQVLVYALVAIGVSGGIGVSSVWMRHQISITANANKAYESRLAEVERQAEETRTAIAQEQDVNVLLRRNADWRLGLVPPRSDQVERVVEDPVTRLAAKRDRDLFQDRARSVSFRVALQH